MDHAEMNEARVKLVRALEELVKTGPGWGSTERVVEALDAYMLEWAVKHHLIVKRDPMD